MTAERLPRKTAFGRSTLAGRTGVQIVLLLLWGMIVFGLKNPARLAEAAGDALVLCVRQVLPILFPIAAAGGLLTCFTPLPRTLCRLPGRWFALSDASVGVLFLSLFSGFPIGAMLASRLLEAGKIDCEEASRLCCYTNNASAAFLVGCVGGGFFGSERLGWLLWIASTASALLIAFVLARRFYKTERGRTHLQANARPVEPSPFPGGAEIAKSISATAFGMLRLTGFVVFFAVFCTFLQDALSVLLPEGVLASLLQAVTAAFFEITGGLSAIAALPFALPVRMGLAGATIGWSGLSVLLQCLAAGDAARGQRLFAGRLLMVPFTGGIAVLLSLLLG